MVVSGAASPHGHSDYGHIEYGPQMFYGELAPNCQEGQGQGLLPSYSIKIPHALEKASMQMDLVRKGMLLTVLDFTPDRYLEVDFRVEISPISFGAILSGQYDVRQSSAWTGQGQELEKPGELICKSCDASGTFSVAAGTRFRMISLAVDENIVEEMFHGHKQYEALHARLKVRQGGLSVMGRWDISTDMNIITAQVLQCRLCGLARKLYLEGKALEILSLQLDKLANMQGRQLPLDKSDIQRLRQAHDLLMDSIENPPSLKELATKVGINDFKLKKGFKELFGYTVYGLLRKHRMEKARNILLEGKASVGEVAFFVGYTNISHFISAFRKQFNATPGEVLQQSRRAYHRTPSAM